MSENTEGTTKETTQTGEITPTVIRANTAEVNLTTTTESLSSSVVETKPGAVVVDQDKQVAQIKPTPLPLVSGGRNDSNNIASNSAKPVDSVQQPTPIAGSDLSKNNQPNNVTPKIDTDKTNKNETKSDDPNQLKVPQQIAPPGGHQEQQGQGQNDQEKTLAAKPNLSVLSGKDDNKAEYDDDYEEDNKNDKTAGGDGDGGNKVEVL